MATQNLLYKEKIDINQHISISIPKMGRVIDDEDNYYNMVSLLTAMPIDLMVQLDNAGIDFTTLNEYELFLLLFPGLKNQDTSLVFGDLDLSRFELDVNEENGMIILKDKKKGIIIDRAIQNRISTTLRKLHNLKKNNKKPGNQEAKAYMLERAKKKLNRHKNRIEESQLESLIIAMVNTKEFKYNFEEVKELSIYQFNESVRQVIKKIDYDNRMHGVYSGTISTKDLRPDDLNWLTNK